MKVIKMKVKKPEEIKKRKIDDMEFEYEKTPRKYHSSIPETVEKLPLKSKEGLIKRIELLKNEKLPESNIDSNDNEQEESSELNDIKQDTMEISEENDDKIPDSIKDLKKIISMNKKVLKKKKRK